MDTQKPQGIKGMWKDDRDTNSWFTFWVAVTFGVTALILALAGLAVSSAQTWAAFEALDVQVAGTAPNASSGS
jgi:hypothetical protein